MGFSLCERISGMPQSRTDSRAEIRTRDSSPEVPDDTRDNSDGTDDAPYVEYRLAWAIVVTVVSIDVFGFLY
jgi:hypothetical protein